MFLPTAQDFLQYIILRRLFYYGHRTRTRNSLRALSVEKEVRRDRINTSVCEWG